ncbi:MAG: nuclear transport factor 2 family protein [Opitutaceae bacterium]|nr:nuclear transport factor 2 family protein [Opitutaceae bacterium]
MKINLLRLLALLALALTVTHAADEKLIAALRAADDERVAATKAGDLARLNAIYSDQLHYAHSNGQVDNKATQTEGVVNSANLYERIEYQERTFLPAGPGIVLMKGRAIFTM